MISRTATPFACVSTFRIEIDDTTRREEQGLNSSRDYNEFTSCVGNSFLYFDASYSKDQKKEIISLENYTMDLVYGLIRRFNIRMDYTILYILVILNFCYG